MVEGSLLQLSYCVVHTAYGLPVYLIRWSQVRTCSMDKDKRRTILILKVVVGLDPWHTRII